MDGQAHDRVEKFLFSLISLNSLFIYKFLLQLLGLYISTERSQASMEVSPQGKYALSPGSPISSTQAFPARPTLEIHQPSTRQTQISEATASSCSFANTLHKVKGKK